VSLRPPSPRAVAWWRRIGVAWLVAIFVAVTFVAWKLLTLGDGGHDGYIDPFDHRSVSLGMSRSQVHELLGDPYRGADLATWAEPGPPGYTCDYYGESGLMPHPDIEAFRFCYRGNVLAEMYSWDDVCGTAQYTDPAFKEYEDEPCG